MARILGRNTAPELVLRRLLHSRGLRYRLDARTPVCRADLVFSRHHVAVFVDGCFWHGCPEHYVRPRSSTAFWSRKLRENVLRDGRQSAELEMLGWTVVRVWEHDLVTDPEAVAALVEHLVRTGRLVGPSVSDLRVIRVDPLVGDLERRHLASLHDPKRVEVVVRRRATTKPRRRASQRESINRRTKA